MGRGPARAEQPAAALVDVAVRRSRSCSRPPTWCSIRAWAACRARSAGRSVGAVRRPSRHAARAATAPLYAKFAGDAGRRRWRATRRRWRIGERLFLNNCAQCHGSDARGSKGFPNLTDATGCRAATPEQIDRDHHRNGRARHDAADGRRGRQRATDVRNVAHYVLSLSGSPHDAIARRARASRSSPPAPPATAPTARATRRSARRTSPTRCGCTAGARRRSSTMIRNGKHQRDAGARRAPDARSRSTCWRPTSGACRTQPHGGRAMTPMSRMRTATRRGDPDPPRRRREAVSLYEKQTKIYPRAVQGWFARWRWALVWLTQLVFYGLPWLPWNGRQAVLFDLAARTLLHLRPGAVAAGLHLPDRPAGHLRLRAVPVHRGRRARSGAAIACPQTVYTEIFLWIERRIEGERSARMKLDAGPWTLDKLCAQGRQARASGSRSALWTGFTFVGYFTPIRTLLGRGCARSAFGPWEWFWVCFYGSPPTATPAGCASRSASTCARTRASRARCSTATR